MGCICDFLSSNDELNIQNKELNYKSKVPILNITEKNNNLIEQNHTNIDEIIGNQTLPKIDININELNNNKNNSQTVNSLIIKLKSNNNEIFKVPKDILLKAKLINELIEYSKEYNEIFLKEVDSKNLELIIEYLQHYKNMEPKEIPKPFPEINENFFRSILNDDWTFDFLQKLSIEDSVDLINCAHYLQIEELINLLSAKLAYEMLNCEPKEVLNKFALKCNVVNEENNG